MWRINTYLRWCVALAIFLLPGFAHAESIVDKLDLSPFVPLVLDALMGIATAGYDFFIGGGTGIIYVLVLGFLILSLSLYGLKLFFPKIWVSFLGFSGGGDLESGTDGMTIAQSALRPCIRAIIALTILLPIKPVYLSQWLINPFLEFGSIYTHAITEQMSEFGGEITAKEINCPPSIVDNRWISENSCKFLVQPVSDLSQTNNRIIKKGFEFINRGIRGLITLVPHGGEDFMNLVTGILLVFTFVASNLFMAMLVIQGIFNFGVSLILYPFSVLTYVVKDSNKWMDIMPALDGIIKALQKLVITMIACAFIMVINIAIVRALFQWNSSVFVVAAGGISNSNIPQVANTGMGFGSHSIMWLSGILTFYVMFRIFNKTRELLDSYTGGDMQQLNKQVKSDWATVAAKGKGAINWVRDKIKKE